MGSYLQQRWRSFGYAFQGVITLLRTQPHARVHLLAAVIVIAMGFYFEVSRLDWVILCVCITLVLAAEAFNTAIEFLTDLVSPDHHTLAGKAKDTAAAAVLICAVGAVIMGLLVFWPYLSRFLG
jgi:diacylglycerol kinase